MWYSGGYTNLISYLKTPKSALVLKFCCCVLNTERGFPSPNTTLYSHWETKWFVCGSTVWCLLWIWIHWYYSFNTGWRQLSTGIWRRLFWRKDFREGFAVRRPSWNCK